MKASLQTLEQHFATVVAANELSHAYLFVGPTNSGKMALAQWLAQRLFCTNLQNGQPCGQCAECRRIVEGNNPDYLVISRDTRTIGVDEIRGLKQELSKSGLEGRQRVFVIQDADKMTPAAANSLLKFLEEPASQVVIILTTTRLARILPTIQSRLQIVTLQAPELAVREQEIQQLGVDSTFSHVLSATQFSLDEIQSWMEQTDLTELQQIFWRWLQQILTHKDLAFALVQTQLIPNFKEQKLQQLLPDLLLAGLSDLFAVKFALARPLNWTNQQDNLQQFANQLSAQQVTELLEIVLQMRRMQEANVSFQNVLEHTTLQLLAVLD
ncbi:DNA polymerase III subunit delta' [Lapidilactobacillus bayanensis]|uniref:DNA polymerase III subunit delta' n=1 Tax=Lapidilactobacillus bayanensis TaxID=2485998 RepID=UPI0013DDBC4E|nr:DNA polymerase III subunit delta' [Lapidilactobacillus bayanensis]